MEQDEILSIIKACENAPQDLKAEALDLLLNKTWDVLFDHDIHEGGYADIFRAMLKTYAQKSFDADNLEIKFDETMPPKTRGLRTEEGIKLNKNFFLFGNRFEDLYKNMDTVAQILITTSHELTHEQDHVANAPDVLVEDKRCPSGIGYGETLIELGQMFPEKAEKYFKLGYALYHNSYEEMLAQKISFAFANNFVDQLIKITDQKYPDCTELYKKREIFKQCKNSGLDPEQALIESNLTLEEIDVLKIKRKLQVIKNRIADKEDDNDLLCMECEEIKKHLLPEARQDFLNLCNKALDANCELPNLSAFPPSHMAWLIKKPEFFDLETVQRLYNFGKANDVIGITGELCTVEELDIPDAERKKFLNEYRTYLKLPTPPTRKREPPSKKEEFHF